MAAEVGSDNTYMNIITFIVLTIVYFMLIKPKLTMDILSNSSNYLAYSQREHYSVGIYFMVIMLVQFAINTSTMVAKCGGSLSSNLGQAALMTFIPWLAIFGILIVMLILFPGMKSAFSDVLGYFVVAGSANKLLSELLVDTEINEKIKQAGDSIDDTKKQAMQDAAEAVMKMVGNISILINQIVPSNFVQYWKMLQPLMKEKYQNNMESLETLTKQQSLLDLVVLRDNIGEGFWYVYTAILLISIIQFNITSKKCEADPSLANAKYDDYLDTQKQADAAKKVANSTTYTLG
jgi:hypothetical protein